MPVACMPVCTHPVVSKVAIFGGRHARVVELQRYALEVDVRAGRAQRLLQRRQRLQLLLLLRDADRVFRAHLAARARASPCMHVC
eukprot:282435-Chlamydomonas_euryale.AAC.1